MGRAENNASNAPVTSQDDEVCSCTVLRKAARRVSMLYDRALAPTGLRITQYAILAELDRSGPMTVTELAHAMVMDRNGLGHNLRPLEREGLVRLAVGLDRRRRVIVMTEIGQGRLAEAKQRWHRAQETFQTTVGIDTAQALRSLSNAAAFADYGELSRPS